MYSQVNEEEIIVGFLGTGRVGRFLDIGAFDGKTFSNTLRLVELGWTGVCVEPAAPAFSALMTLHKERSNIHLVNAAIGVDRGLVTFYESGGDAVSSTDEAHKHLWESGGPTRFQTVTTCAVTIEDLLARFPPPYDFVNLDVEGINLPIFRTLPLDRLGALLLCVEYEDHLDEIEGLAREYGYERLALAGANTILARR